MLLYTHNINNVDIHGIYNSMRSGGFSSRIIPQNLS